jgi:hypothetical protein
MLYPRPNRVGSRKRGAVSVTVTEMKKSNVTAERLSAARQVLAYSEESQRHSRARPCVRSDRPVGMVRPTAKPLQREPFTRGA